MPYFTARHIISGILYTLDFSPSLLVSDDEIIQANAARALGGVAADYEAYLPTDAQVAAIQAVLPGRAYIDAQGNVTSKSVTLTSDKAQILTDNTDTATLTANVNDPSYTGDVRFTVTTPEGTTEIETVAAVAGVATMSLTTGVLGDHQITAEAVAYGVSSAVNVIGAAA